MSNHYNILYVVVSFVAIIIALLLLPLVVEVHEVRVDDPRMRDFAERFRPVFDYYNKRICNGGICGWERRVYFRDGFYIVMGRNLWNHGYSMYISLYYRAPNMSKPILVAYYNDIHSSRDNNIRSYHHENYVVENKTLFGQFYNKYLR